MSLSTSSQIFWITVHKGQAQYCMYPWPSCTIRKCELKPSSSLGHTSFKMGWAKIGSCSVVRRIEREKSLRLWWYGGMLVPTELATSSCGQRLSTRYSHLQTRHRRGYKKLSFKRCEWPWQVYHECPCVFNSPWYLISVSSTIISAQGQPWPYHDFYNDHYGSSLSEFYGWLGRWITWNY